jgi:hypothetical protein
VHSELPGLEVPGGVLGEFLEHLLQVSGVRLIPHDQPKYFRYYSAHETNEFVLVDVHVDRDGVEVCPKQDLRFPLIAADVVSAGMLAC